MLDLILPTFLSQKSQIRESFNKLHGTIHPILKLKISLVCIENVLLNRIHFVNDITLASDNPLKFRKLFLENNKIHEN